MKKRILLGITAISSAFMVLQAQSFKDDIVSHWKLDETDGTTFSDEYTGASGEVMGDAANWKWDTGINNNCLNFMDADTSNIGVVEDDGSLDAINFTEESFSVSVWVKCSADAFDGLTGNAEQTIFMKGDNGTDGPNGNGNRYAFSTKESKIYWSIDDDVTKSQLNTEPGQVTWPDNEWVNLIGIRDLNTYKLKLYMNGEFVMDYEDGTLEPLDLSGQRMIIGNYHNHANPFHGSIDEIMIIKKALSETEVSELYSSYQTSGIFNNRVTENIKVTPNPVASDLIISNASKLTKVEVYSLNGAVVKTITNSQNATIRTNVDDLPTGKYIVKAMDSNNVISTGSFIKQ